MLNPSDKPPEQQNHLKPLQNLIHNHPLAFWSGAWTTLALMGSVAAFNLLNPGSIEEASVPSPTLSTIQQSVVAEPEPSVPAQVPNAVREPVRQSTLKKDLPLSLFGAIAIGCAAGSLLVMQNLRQSTPRRQSSKRLKPKAAVRKKRRPPSNGYPPVPRTPQPVPPQPTFQTLNTQLARTNNSLNQVTVLPPEESHPLDRGEESLADMMDLRKRHSLSSLMRGR